MIRRQLLAVAIASVMAFGSLMIIASPTESAADNQILYEGFDGGWDPGWYVTDHNMGNGSDYWGVTGHRKAFGNGSAWCAQIGSNSENDLENSVNHYYDQGMQAVLQITLPDLSGYESVTLEFYYWADTGNIALNDYVEARTWNGWFWQHLWKQPDVDTGGSWHLIRLEIPLNTVWLSFSFVSDDRVGYGPYEGVYLDAVSVYGWDETPPTSSITDLDEFYSAETIYIVYTAVDRGGSGVDHVELYYRKLGIGTYEMYTTPDNPTGTWMEGVIPFNCSLADGFGGYDFYTLAEDVAANREVPTVIPQASTMLDMAAPSTEVNVPSGLPSDGWINESISIELYATDDLSGVARTMFSIDSSPWSEYDGQLIFEEDGDHRIAFYSEDNAGNKEGAKSIEFAMDTVSPNASLSPLYDNTPSTDRPVAGFSWYSEDELSGIDYCLFRIDDRAFEFLGDSSGFVEVASLADGEHTATLRAYDNAGNYIELSYDFVVDLGEAEAGVQVTSELVGWIAAIAVLLAALVVVLMLVRLRRRSDR
jgi:hypothetical protein